MGWLVSATLWPFYPLERGRFSTVQGTGCVPGPVWTGEQNVAITGIRYVDRLRVRGGIVHQVGIYLRKSAVVELTDSKKLSRHTP